MEITREDKIKLLEGRLRYDDNSGISSLKLAEFLFELDEKVDKLLTKKEDGK
jgi:hypothetical protein